MTQGSSSDAPIAATRIRALADRFDRESVYEDDGYTAGELLEDAKFLRETADLIERLEANQRSGRIIHGDAE